ncbi:MAG: TonB-dependent receptor [Lacibacter sp.]
MQKSLLSLIIISVLSVISVTAQDKTIKDSTVTFQVSGACTMCKDRIEAAAKGRGVTSAVWNVHTKMITLVYNAEKTSPQKVKERIVEAGHDIGEMKANDNTYKNLPSCCHYRELGMMSTHEDGDDDHSTAEHTSATVIKGVVLEETNKGHLHPLQGATIQWLQSGKGVVTDSNGVFAIEQIETANKLIISYTGYKADTIDIADMKALVIVLAKGKELSEVVVNAKQRSLYIAALNPVRTQIMTEKELFKAACCNLSESFETNPSVDVSYNDAVTGSKQIQLLGLSGNYTQLTVENLPGPRGLATPMGLNTIAGPWIESIQLTKGIGSVVNGFESIAGQINIELKKPEKSEKLYFNLYQNDMGKFDANLNLSHKIGKKWSTTLLLHNDFLNNHKVDFNKDGFRDLPTGAVWSGINRWKYEDNNGWIVQFGIKALTDNKTGGEVTFNPEADKLTTNKYGLGINVRRYEAFAKTGYVFPEKKYKSIGLQLSAFNHQQNSYFGLTTYNAKQQNFYGNLIYQSIIGNTAHKFRTGLSFVYDKYDETFNSTGYKRTETVPGAFFEYTYDYLTKFSIVAGIRADDNNLYGWFVTPRLHLRYEPVKGSTFRISAGRGQRTANIFAENTGVFVSSRTLEIITAVTGKAYGLNPEIAWNKGISFDQQFRLFNRNASLALDFFRNDFTQQIVADLEDVNKIRFYNLNGKSYSNSFQIELNTQPFKNFDVRLAYRLFDVKTTYSNQLLQKPFTAKNRAFANLAYEVKSWKFDYTVNYNSSKRIPSTTSNPTMHQQPATSPDYVIMNAQVSKTVGKKQPVDLYIGGENLTGYYQKNAIIAAEEPFGSHFDASLVWGPISGRMLYAGLRWKLK